MVDKTIRLTAEGKRLTEELEKLAGLQLKVGYQYGITYPDSDVQVVDVAAWNELGTSNGIPSRPFMRNSYELHEDELNAFVVGEAKQLLNGGTAEEFMKKIGVFQKGLIQKEIRDGDFAPNAPSTIVRKGSDHPLIDTGLMRQSVQYEIKKGGG